MFAASWESLWVHPGNLTFVCGWWDLVGPTEPVEFSLLLWLFWSRRSTEPRWWRGGRAGKKFEVGELGLPLQKKKPDFRFFSRLIMLLVFPEHDLLLVLTQKTVILKARVCYPQHQSSVFNGVHPGVNVVPFLNRLCSHLWLNCIPKWMWCCNDYLGRNVEKDQDCHPSSGIWTMCAAL